MKKIINLFKKNSRKILCTAIMILFLVLSVGVLPVKAAIYNETIYTYNNPGIEDWKHEITTDTSDYKVEMAENITGWVKKDSENDVVLVYSTSVTGTVGYTVETESGLKASLFDEVLSLSTNIKTSLSYSYSTTTLKSITYTISPTEEGEFFCIGINYRNIRSDIKHYHQKFKLFGQGEYVYKCSSAIYSPTETYIAKNYKYDIFGEIYEK